MTTFPATISTRSAIPSPAGSMIGCRSSSISPRPTPRFHLPAAACACSGAASSTRPSPTTPHRSRSIRPSVTSRSRATGYPARRTVSGQRLKLWSCSAPASRPSRRPRPRQKPKQKTRQRARPGRRTSPGPNRRRMPLHPRRRGKAASSGATSKAPRWPILDHGCRRYLRTPDFSPALARGGSLQSISAAISKRTFRSIPTAFRTGASAKG